MLVMNYGKYRGFIMKRLLKITEKVSQFKEVVRRVIWKSKVELNRKFERMKTQIF